jgi:hypothetical protein
VITAVEALPLLGIVSAIAYPLGKALVVWVRGKMHVAEIEAMGKVMVDLAKLEPDQAERLQARLDRVRPPPPPDQSPELDRPPAAS